MLKETTNQLNLSFNLKIDRFNFIDSALLENIKCFGCGGEGHLI